METFYGYLSTPHDALLLFEACRLGRLQRIRRRLSESERNAYVRSGAVFVWDEEESGIKRWTDGRHWSPSRINGSFLVYREVEPRRAKIDLHTESANTVEYIPKEGGLIKKAISITIYNNKKQHLVSYYTREDVNNGLLSSPVNLPLFADINISTDIYPEFTPETAAGPATNGPGGGSAANGTGASGNVSRAILPARAAGRASNSPAGGASQRSGSRPRGSASRPTANRPRSIASMRSSTPTGSVSDSAPSGDDVRQDLTAPQAASAAKNSRMPRRQSPPQMYPPQSSEVSSSMDVDHSGSWHSDHAQSPYPPHHQQYDEPSSSSHKTAMSTTPGQHFVQQAETVTPPSPSSQSSGSEMGQGYFGEYQHHQHQVGHLHQQQQPQQHRQFGSSNINSVGGNHSHVATRSPFFMNNETSSSAGSGSPPPVSPPTSAGVPIPITTISDSSVTMAPVTTMAGGGAGSWSSARGGVSSKLQLPPVNLNALSLPRPKLKSPVPMSRNASSSSNRNLSPLMSGNGNSDSPPLFLAHATWTPTIFPMHMMSEAGRPSFGSLEAAAAASASVSNQQQNRDPAPSTLPISSMVEGSIIVRPQGKSDDVNGTSVETQSTSYGSPSSAPPAIPSMVPSPLHSPGTTSSVPPLPAPVADAGFQCAPASAASRSPSLSPHLKQAEPSNGTAHRSQDGGRQAPQHEHQNSYEHTHGYYHSQHPDYHHHPHPQAHQGHHHHPHNHPQHQQWHHGSPSYGHHHHHSYEADHAYSNGYTRTGYHQGWYDNGPNGSGSGWDEEYAGKGVNGQEKRTPPQLVANSGWNGHMPSSSMPSGPYEYQHHQGQSNNQFEREMGGRSDDGAYAVGPDGRGRYGSY
ncbi:hypothetical protein HK102_013320 [Quaeritorhiza haematococci]|nr:hypothetical protein HK102_013320 [Quaeritorhiza haematococci]